MKNSRLRALVVKEFKQTLRDKITLAILLVMPIVELFIIGFAVNMDIKHVWTAVFDQSRSQDSREMIRSFTSSNYFDIKLYANSVNEVNEAVQAGYAKIGVIIPSDYASKIHGGRNTKLQVIVDATDSLSANSAMAAAQTLGILKSNELLRQQAMRHGINLSGQLVEMRTKLWYNPDFVTSWYMIPGIMGLLLSISLITLMGMAIVREAEQGTLEQLLVTPMQAWELLLSKICPYIIIGYLQIVLSLVIGMIFFDMPFVGSLPLFMLLTFFYVVSDLAFGIMISTFSDNQLQALQLSTFIILPSVMLSGFIFPIESMPKFFQFLSWTFPVTFYNDLARQIILKGGGMEYVWDDVVALCIFIAVVFTSSVVKFKKKFVP
ncbi:MAG: ABC transporter permease [Synergistaceae bacterium]|nr:ABC transporter permease [Synergistaceae bacterium]